MSAEETERPKMQQVSENLFLVPEGVLIFCPGHDFGGRFDSPFQCHQEFFDQLLAKFPDPSVHLLIRRYVQLGWMRELMATRMKRLGYSQEKIKSVQKKISVFLAEEEKEYVALGYAPISFAGYDPNELEEYEAKLLERAGIPA
ncbi:hypothetical protein DRH29_00145 [candidate division Kazan bacterium]|uniref:Uncharacterized protein n=1 Tax=candidate division Kazan bacterium TaxID=2202143 RepID=A0A420ZDS6_UNCK3|nr:MAG: hypothetical protein DRH29_00145 [candidate division Kazan bacterium]